MQIQSTKQNASQKFWTGGLICIVAALFYCYEFILRILPGALQAELSAAFGNISATAFGQISAAYYFAYSPMQLPVGMLMDRYGPRRLLIFACLCCTLGSWFFMQTDSISLSSFGRFLVGFGSSFAFVGVLTLALHWLPRKYFSFAAGLITTLGMLGLVYGEVKIADIALSMGWKHVLYLTVIGGFGLNFIIFLVVRDAPVSYINHTNSARVFFNHVKIILFDPQIWIIGVIGACLYTSLSVFGELWGQTYLEQAHHLSKLEAAHAVSALFLGWAVGAPIFGYISDRSGHRLLLLIIGAIMSLICIGFILYYTGIPYIILNILLFAYDVFSATEIIIFIMGKENSMHELSGTAFAVVNMIVTLGGVILQPLVR